MAEISSKSDLQIKLVATYRGEMRRAGTLVFEITLKEAAAWARHFGNPTGAILDAEKRFFLLSFAP